MNSLRTKESPFLIISYLVTGKNFVIPRPDNKGPFPTGTANVVSLIGVANQGNLHAIICGKFKSLALLSVFKRVNSSSHILLSLYTASGHRETGQ